MGLLLVSPAFLGSRFIDGKELPRLIGHAGKPIVPVMLQPVSFELHDLKGLSEYQIYLAGGTPAFHCACTFLRAERWRPRRLARWRPAAALSR